MSGDIYICLRYKNENTVAMLAQDLPTLFVDSILIQEYMITSLVCINGPPLIFEKSTHINVLNASMIQI
jgi:hypothetical protein